MNKIETFQQFLATQSPDLSLSAFLANLTLAAILAYILYKVYIKFGDTLSNRKNFGKNFVIIALTTMTIITIVKSSLALSLGLVGALSIVRFRAAIKEPEELSYLYLTIAIGLGLGADQRGVTVVAFLFIIGVIIARKKTQKDAEEQNLYITVSDASEDKIQIKDIIDVLKKHCSAVQIRRFDEAEDMLEASFQVQLEDFESIDSSKKDLQALSKTIKIHYLDSTGV